MHSCLESSWPLSVLHWKKGFQQVPATGRRPFIRSRSCLHNVTWIEPYIDGLSSRDPRPHPQLPWIRYSSPQKVLRKPSITLSTRRTLPIFSYSPYDKLIRRKFPTCQFHWSPFQTPIHRPLYSQPWNFCQLWPRYRNPIGGSIYHLTQSFGIEGDNARSPSKLAWLGGTAWELPSDFSGLPSLAVYAGRVP